MKRCATCGKEDAASETTGAQLRDGAWACSETCWEVAALIPAARKMIEAAARLDAARKVRDYMREHVTDWQSYLLAEAILHDAAALARIVEGED